MRFCSHLPDGLNQSNVIKNIKNKNKNQLKSNFWVLDHCTELPKDVFASE